MEKHKEALIFGATGNVGGATASELLRRGWRVRAVTRDPQSEKARRLQEIGATLVKADMNERASVEAVVDGAEHLFSVQNWVTSGVEGEIKQARIVADAAKNGHVKHIVYSSAGVGTAGTNIPHFENKIEIEAYMRDLALPLTIIRPSPFMELMSDKEFFPPLTAWGTMRRIMGWDLPLPWIAVSDIGQAAANAFDAPGSWIGREVNLIGDFTRLSECRDIFKKVNGRKPLGIPLPPALYRRVAPSELVDMWIWFVEWYNNEGAAVIEDDIAATREIIPAPLSVEDWLRKTIAAV